MQQLGMPFFTLLTWSHITSKSTFDSMQHSSVLDMEIGSGVCMVNLLSRDYL